MFVLPVLVVLTLVTVVSWIVSKLIDRRHLYAAARKFKGPPYIPFFGVSFDLLKNPSGFLHILNGYLEQYPGVCTFWFGSQLILAITRPDYAETIMNNPNCYAKMAYMYKSLRCFIGEGLISGQDVATWKRHRKVINPSFSQRILKGYMEVFVNNCSILMEKLKKLDGKGVVDIQAPLCECTLDIVCESMMGVKVHAQTTDSTMHKVFDRLLDVALLRMITISYHMDWYFNRTKLFKENNKNLDILNDFTNKVIETKTEQHENKNLQMTAEMEAQLEDYVKTKALSDRLIEQESFTQKEIKDEIVTFIMAGADTSSGTAGFALVMLAIHSDIQDKVLEEVLSVIGPDRNIEFQDLSQLIYLERCLKETLRLFPAAPFTFRQAEADVKLDDETTFPKGTGIMFGIMAMHRSATYWPDPLKFDPERFLPENVAKRHPYAFIPFSGGPRSCIGSSFAYMSMKILVATIIRQYKITTSYKSVTDIELTANIVVRMVNGVKISLQHR